MIRKGLHGGSYQPLTDQDIDKIHNTVMELIADVGFEVNSENALELFAGAGAIVDRKEHRVRVTQDRVMDLINMAPSEIVLAGQPPPRAALGRGY